MKATFFRIDWWLLLPVTILLLFSFATLLSLQSSFAQSQFVSLILSVVVFIFFSQIDYRSLQNFRLPIYLLSLFLFGLTLVLGFESRGAVRWIEIFGVSAQFSEIMKPFLLFALAGYLVAKDRYTFRSFITILLFATPLVLLTYAQPDLGNALIYLGVTMSILFFSGFPLLWFVFLSIPVAILLPFIWSRFHEYQRIRVLTFLNPTSDPQGTSYNAIQSIIAVGSGMLLGRGAQEGTQAELFFLPERHTDFIFATISEGYGFLGAVAIILAFLFLFYRIYWILQRTDEPYAKIIALGTLLLIFVHFFVNIGMNIGVFPIVGVTLPFVSLGGSSLLSNFILLGVLSSISTSLRRTETLEIH